MFVNQVIFAPSSPVFHFCISSNSYSNIYNLLFWVYASQNFISMRDLNDSANDVSDILSHYTSMWDFNDSTSSVTDTLSHYISV